VGWRFNSLLLNLYRDGRYKLDRHADSEPEHNPEAPIASLSLWAFRSFRMRPNSAGRTPADTLSFELGQGDLVVMDPPPRSTGSTMCRSAFASATHASISHSARSDHRLSGMQNQLHDEVLADHRRPGESEAPRIAPPTAGGQRAHRALPARARETSEAYGDPLIRGVYLLRYLPHYTLQLGDLLHSLEGSAELAAVFSPGPGCVMSHSAAAPHPSRSPWPCCMAQVGGRAAALHRARSPDGVVACLLAAEC